jgi:hypothetical protein
VLILSTRKAMLFVHIRMGSCASHSAIERKAVIIAAIRGQYRRRRCGYYLALRMLYTMLLCMSIVEYLRSQGAILKDVVDGYYSCE